MHKCSYNNIKWDTYIGTPEYLGIRCPLFAMDEDEEGVHRNGICEVCGREVRELWIDRHFIDNKTDKEISL